MSETGKLTTFFRLLCDESSIRIPKVQRDYAYGRDEEKPREILSGMLDNMLGALKEDRQEILDFVYGGPYAKDDDSQTGMIPLDGQQRLTTLFLLHFYASLFAFDSEGQPVDVSMLKNFSYETRQSANDFRLKLVTDIRKRLTERKYHENPSGISTLIEEDSDFSPAYSYDPTISSMLVVLGEIEKRFATFPDLWQTLTTKDNLCFYHITLEKFGLTDELYIKMNSRGKKLTEFEIFKADFLDGIRRSKPDNVFEIARKLDTEWMDMVWDQFPEKPAETDLAYMCMLRNLKRMACNRFLLRAELSEDDPSVTTKDEVEFMEDVLDFMYTVFNDKGGFSRWWSEFYYEDNNVLGREDGIRLFKMEESLFVRLMKEPLSVPEFMIFYATYLSWTYRLTKEESFRRLRIVRNLMRANQRANSAHTSDLPLFMRDIRKVMESGELPSANVSKFIGTSLEEENMKLSLKPDDYKALLKYENHLVLDASLSLFMDSYLGKDSECSVLINELDRFTRFFNDSCRTKEVFERLRISLINKEIGYWQAPVNNEKDAVKRRFFFHAPKDYQSFFFKNRTREHQEEILEVLQMIGGPDRMKDNEQKCREFAIDDWRYYMTRYPASNNPLTNSGCYGWKDIESRPLEVFILNSTYFEEWNLGWSMMLNILFARIESTFLLRWDTHQRPIDISDLGLFIDFTQQGWILSSVDFPERLRRIKDVVSEVSATSWNETDMTLIIPHDPQGEKDYIENIVNILAYIKSNDESL